jgi:SAM-dependent methyltransferase
MQRSQSNIFALGRLPMSMVMNNYSLNFFRRATSQPVIWPSIDFELIEPKKSGLLMGKVLNAGAGWRDISHLVEGELVNQDITWPGDSRTNIDIFSPLHEIPVPDHTFDTILCIAVLEHVENPEEVALEFFRVLKPGGYVVASVPFLQPEHKTPTDFQRYTKDGIEHFFDYHGFDIVYTRNLFSVYHTLHWIAYEWLHLKNNFLFKLLRVLILPPLVYMARSSSLSSDKLASAFQVLVRKPLSEAV